MLFQKINLLALKSRYLYLDQEKKYFLFIKVPLHIFRLGIDIFTINIILDLIIYIIKALSGDGHDFMH
jgi:hypothetical protein